MWLATGPFDIDLKINPPSDKTKVLETGREYGLGRKGPDLVINHSKASKVHAQIAVGEFSEDDVTNPNSVPPLVYHNITKRSIQVIRNGVPATVINPMESGEVHNEDLLEVVGGLTLKFEWKKICCYIPSRPKPSISVEACAKLGINLLHSPHSEVTHHLSPTFSLTPALATSLLANASIVRPEWLNQLIEHANVPIGLQNFELPRVDKFNPAFASNLPRGVEKTFATFKPDLDRLHLFRGYRFVFVLSEKNKNQVDPEMRELVKRGSGEYECFNASSGANHFHRVLAKGMDRVTKEGGKSLVVTVEDLSTIEDRVGKDIWKGLVEEIRIFGLKLVEWKDLLLAVVNINTSSLNASGAVEAGGHEAPGTSEPSSSTQDLFASPVPSLVPNTHPDEPSHPPSTAETAQSLESQPEEQSQRSAEAGMSRKSLERRAMPTSREGTPPNTFVQPSDNDDQAGKRPPVRRALTRRANLAQSSVLSGVDDDVSVSGSQDSALPSVTIVTGGPRRRERSVEPPAQPASQSQNQFKVPATPRSSRLKRRAGTALAAQLSGIEEEDGGSSSQFDDKEPPHKKFKALFEESDPDRVQSGSGGISQSQLELRQTQSEQSSFSYPWQSGTPLGESQVEGTQTQADDGPGSGAGLKRLEAVREEEEEESQSQIQNQARGAKRRREDEMDVDEEGDHAPAAKRRALENVNDTRPVPERHESPGLTSEARRHPSPQESPSKKSGAPPGQPDTDQSFLKAVASKKKRGKPTEDDFDKEFNKLRISKPRSGKERDQDADVPTTNAGTEEEEAEWEVMRMEDFGNVGVRGNFMLVVEMDVPENRGRRGDVRRGEGRFDWEGRKDFKKFKRKTPGHDRRQIVQLVPSDDGGGFDVHRAPTQLSQAEEFPEGGERHADEAQPPAPADSAGQKQDAVAALENDLDMDVEEDEGGTEPALSARSHGSFDGGDERRAGLEPSATWSTNHSVPAPSRQNEPLFLDEEQDEDAEDEYKDDDQDFDFRDGEEDKGSEMGADDDAESSTLPSTAPGGSLRSSQRTSSQRTRARKAAVTKAVVMDDDSDDEMTFRPVPKKQKGRRG